MDDANDDGKHDYMVTAVSCSGDYTFTKPTRSAITLLEGLGVEGDVHMGVTVKHRSRVARDPTQPNLRQVHLMHAELHDELRAAGFDVDAGQLGENITTRGLPLLDLPTNTRLLIGSEAIIEVTGLRNPCVQIDHFGAGLLAKVVGRDPDGNVVRKAGVMAVVRKGGVVRAGDRIRLELPAQPHGRLEVV
ncbi:MAG: MOSC domain-containing protein [Acidothermaceae bacterium]